MATNNEIESGQLLATSASAVNDEEEKKVKKPVKRASLAYSACLKNHDDVVKVNAVG